MKYNIIIMLINALIQYNNNAYSKTTGSLWQYYRNEPALDNNNNIIDNYRQLLQTIITIFFPANNNSNGTSFNFKQQITGKTGNGGTKDVETMVSLKYLSIFWRTLEMPLIICEISIAKLDYILVAGTAANQNPKFKITDTKLYVPIITLSTQDNVKLLKQLESGFKGTINWNKCLHKIKNESQNRYLDVLIDRSFQRVSRLFVLIFKDEDGQERHKQYYLPTVEMKEYNVMIDGKNFFDQPIKMI